MRDESSRTADAVKAVLGAPALVVKLDAPPGPASWKPEGVSVIVAWPLGNPSALAVMVTVPLLAKPCRYTPLAVLRVWGIANFTCWDPQTAGGPGHVAAPAISSLVGSLLVTLTSKPPVGAGTGEMIG